MATRIMHTAVASQAPGQSARILAEMTQGTAHPFRAKGLLTGAWVCMWNADTNELLEFIPHGYVMVPAKGGAAFAETEHRLGYNVTHIQLQVDLPLAHIKEVATKYDCHQYFRPASGGPLYEVWLEDQILIEFVSPEIQSLKKC